MIIFLRLEMRINASLCLIDNADKEDKRVAYLKYIEDQFLLLGSIGIKPYTDAAVCKSVAKDVLELGRAFHLYKVSYKRVNHMYTTP
jgi:hypothetical protein